MHACVRACVCVRARTGMSVRMCVRAVNLCERMSGCASACLCRWLGYQSAIPRAYLQMSSMVRPSFMDESDVKPWAYGCAVAKPSSKSSSSDRLERLATAWFQGDSGSGDDVSHHSNASSGMYRYCWPACSKQWRRCVYVCDQPVRCFPGACLGILEMCDLSRPTLLLKKCAIFCSAWVSPDVQTTKSNAC